MQKKQEELPNIDADDVGNQLAVVDYIEDIYSFYRKTEVNNNQRDPSIISVTKLFVLSLYVHMIGFLCKKAQSCVPPDYMSRQTNINHNMRAILVDWLIEVINCFQYILV